MADRQDCLTQLQDCLDVLNTQMFASLNYVHTRHPYGEIPGQPSQAPRSAADQAANSDGQQGEGQDANTNTPNPETPDAFTAALRELAQDLILQEQQIEIIVNQLPGIGSSEADQEQRMRELEVEMRLVEKQRAEKEAEREEMVQLLGEVIGRVKRVP